MAANLEHGRYTTANGKTTMDFGNLLIGSPNCATATAAKSNAERNRSCSILAPPKYHAHLAHARDALQTCTNAYTKSPYTSLLWGSLRLAPINLARLARKLQHVLRMQCYNIFVSHPRSCGPTTPEWCHFQGLK